MDERQQQTVRAQWDGLSADAQQAKLAGLRRLLALAEAGGGSDGTTRVQSADAEAIRQMITAVAS